MSEEASEIPMATFCTGNGLDGATLYSLVTHSNRGPKPRTHLANVIIRDNIMEKKMLELKVRPFHSSFYFFNRYSRIM
ncbi:hypothetical protein GDO81_002444 [Engystomops pustulosus]|uniref:Uncharacterized protein n=1 Tax=Engystomops pustulosus TaxID=76066 RepID=A0AAV7DKA1_ENGPU|nr:hypothetical protein GDO81_002444 [Engystomops pustulosus]